MRITAAILIFLVSSSSAVAQDVQGKLIFAVEAVESSMSVGPLKRRGIFFYYEETIPGQYGPLITNYQYRNGEIVRKRGGGGAESEIFINKLLAHTIVNFDVQAEIENTIEFLQSQPREDGSGYLPPMALDGAKYRIIYDFNGINLEYEAWNPGPVIDDLAKYSPNIKSLKELIDLFAIEYARQDFGL